MKKYFVQNIGPISLDNRHFKARGGEGDIFVRGDIAYKICHSGKMIAKAKIDELQCLDHPNIIKPINLILDKHNHEIGYTMKYVKDTYEMCQLFTTAFKNQHKLCGSNGLNLHKLIDIVKTFQELVSFIHSKNILVVDLNEYNFLISNDFNNVYAIDTNSYQTPSFPANAIMATIRDPLAKQWTELSDWYSWGIIVCQILLNIHPYKGGHPDYTSLPKNERLFSRMKNHISIFNSKATLPSICPDLNILPSALYNWMVAVYEQGKRILPPTDYDASLVIATAIRKIVSNVLDLTEINRSLFVAEPHILDIKYNKPIFIKFQNNRITLNNTIYHGQVDSYFVYDNRLYIKNNGSILELSYLDNGLITSQVVSQVLNLPHATHTFDGCIIQEIYDDKYAYIFPAKHTCYTIALNELAGRIIDAKYENKILIVIAYDNHKYVRHTFVLNDNYSKYRHASTDSSTILTINFTVLENGIAILLNENDELELFYNDIHNADTKLIQNTGLNQNIQLLHNGVTLLVLDSNKLYKAKLK